MTKKYQTKIFIKTFSFALLCTCFLYALPDKVLAVGAQLEVNYPTISGQALTANTTLPGYVKYLFNLGILIGFFAVFVSLIIAGVMYFLSPVKTDLLSEAKDRISGAISGLLILVLTYLIITTINPQLSVFHFNEPPSSPPPVAEKQAPGVYFYNKTGCSGDAGTVNTSSFPDLGVQKNSVSSVGIIQNPKAQIYYIPILYNNINLRGACQYVDPNQPCSNVPPFPPNSSGMSSVSIYSYNFTPNGDGVYFYRKSYYNEAGGFFRVDNSKIKGIFVEELANMSFVNNDGKCNVPEDEQYCVKYDAEKKCIERGCPTLAGEDISSIKIVGDYVVLLVYMSSGKPGNPKANPPTPPIPPDNPLGPWTSCQEFPTPDDANGLGPQQIKWESIRNTAGVIPNYVIIIPIQK